MTACVLTDLSLHSRIITRVLVGCAIRIHHDHTTGKHTHTLNTHLHTHTLALTHALTHTHIRLSER